MKKFLKVMFWICFFPIAIIGYVFWLIATDKGRGGNKGRRRTAGIMCGPGGSRRR
jgi:hypothetical protein